MSEFPILNAVLYTGAGILAFIASAAILAKLAPFDVWHQIVHEHNLAVGILAGAVALGVCWIIAATMH